MKQWFSPWGDKSMKTEDVETHVFLFMHTSGIESGAPSDTGTDGGTPANTPAYMWPVSTPLANPANRCCTSVTSRGASKFIQTNHKVMNTHTFFTLCSTLFIFTTYTG